jgi:medium-chain acyl-[acyl-carrier-protein] hydrolase
MEVYEATSTVRTFECRPDGTIRIASLMQSLQEAAALHAEQLGFGFKKLGEINSYWVLSNFRLEIARLPVWREQVTIRTWPSGYNRVIASREFVGVDQDHHELFKAGSEWMILDKQKNRPKNLFRLDLDLPKTGEKALSEKLDRLERSEGYQKVDRVCVPYSSIDLNRHVNNTEYVRWGFDALRRAFTMERAVRSIQVSYLSEVFEGDELNLLVASDTRGRFHILGRKADAEKDVYLMEVRF